jgi:phage-related protein
LSIFYCEEVFVFLGYCGMDDEGYFDALVRMFEQALKYVMALPEAKRPPFIDRLEQVALQGPNVGWGVGDDMERLLAEYGIND